MPPPPALGLQAHRALLDFFTGVLGFELRSSRVHSQCFTYRASSCHLCICDVNASVESLSCAKSAVRPVWGRCFGEPGWKVFCPICAQTKMGEGLSNKLYIGCCRWGGGSKMWKGPQERGVTSRWGLRKKTDSENPAEIAFIAGSRSGMGELFWRE